MILPAPVKATTQQVSYLMILASDLGFTHTSRKAFLYAEYGVSHLDELSIDQAARLIEKWKLQREGTTT